MHVRAHSPTHTLTHTHTHQQALHSKGVGQQSVKGGNPPGHSSKILHLFFCPILICNRDETTDTGGEGRVLQWEASVRRLLVIEVLWERQRVGTDRITMVINLHMVSPVISFTPNIHITGNVKQNLFSHFQVHVFRYKIFCLIVTSVAVSELPGYPDRRHTQCVR